MQGTTIEITLWRSIADKFYEHIEEGQVGCICLLGILCVSCSGHCAALAELLLDRSIICVSAPFEVCHVKNFYGCRYTTSGEAV